MLELDGSGGGGQLLRTALSLSVLSGTPFRMEGVRANRPEPGLRPQHVAAVKLLAAIGDADVSGAEVGAETLAFEPRGVRPGTYDVDIGTAGSVTLLFDAVLPLAGALDGPIAVRATGGTDVKWAPTVDHYRRVKLPLLRRYGVGAAVDLDRRGFYPAGGGEATLWLGPSSPRPFDLASRGSAVGARVYSAASADLADRDVAERQAGAASERLDDLGVSVVERTVQYAATLSTGSVVTIRLDCEGSTAGFDRLGERGTPAESVADAAVEGVRSFTESAAPVDVHTGDQLLVVLAMAGGQVAVPELTDHVETNAALPGRFGYEVSVDRSGPVPLLSADARTEGATARTTGRR